MKGEREREGEEGGREREGGREGEGERGEWEEVGERGREGGDGNTSKEVQTTIFQKELGRGFQPATEREREVRG